MKCSYIMIKAFSVLIHAFGKKQRATYDFFSLNEVFLCLICAVGNGIILEQYAAFLDLFALSTILVVILELRH